MKKRGVILVLGIFVISSLIVVFNSYNVSNPIISDNNPGEIENSFKQENNPKASDGFDPNEDFSSSKNIAEGYYTNLDVGPDEDWYNISLNLEESIEINISFLHSLGNIDLEFRNITNDVLATSYSLIDNESIYFIANIPNVYFIRVFNVTLPTNYNLTIRIDDKYEQNDDFGSAAYIDMKYHPSLICKDDDWYEIWVNNGEQFNVELYFSNSTGNLELELWYSSTIKLDESKSKDDNEYITWTAGSSDYYYIHVYSLSTDNIYDLNIYTSGSGEDTFEENDNFGAAIYLDPSYYSGLYCQDDDWFYFRAYPGDQIMVDIHFNNNSGNLDLELYSDGGSLLAWSYSINDDESVTWFVSSSHEQFYYIRINNSGQANYYHLDIKMFHDPYEPNNDRNTAVELNRGSHYNLWCRDDDWYMFKTDMGEQIIVHIYFKDSGMSGDLDLEVKDYMGGSVDGSYSTTDDEFITFTAIFDNFYYIRVYNKSASDQNMYVLIFGSQPELIFQEDFEGPISSKWSGFEGGNYWHVTTRDSSPFSPPTHSHSLWCGNELTGWYDKGYSYTDSIAIIDLDLRDYCFAGLYFDCKYTTGMNKDDEIGVAVKVLGEQFYLNPKYTDNDFNILNKPNSTTGWENVSYDLSFFCGYEHVDIIFYFKANDFDNFHEGVMIDNLRIEGIKDDELIGNSLGIEVEDEYYYYISYIDQDAWSNEIFGRGIFWGDAYIKIEIFAIYDMGSYWDVVARFWEPWDDFDDLANTEEVHYKIYKNPLNMKDGADLFIPSNNLWTYLDKADNYDRFDWFVGYDIHHWYDNHWNEHHIEFSYDDFMVHLTYSTNGILMGMQIFKSSTDMRKIFEMWRSDYKDGDDGEEGEEERDAIPGYDIPIFIAIISIMSIISAIRIKKSRKK